MCVWVLKLFFMFYIVFRISRLIISRINQSLSFLCEQLENIVKLALFRKDQGEYLPP